MFTGASSAAELMVIVGLPPDTMVAHELSRPAIQATNADAINVLLFINVILCILSDRLAVTYYKAWLVQEPFPLILTPFNYTPKKCSKALSSRCLLL